jgi:hypothetical protein
VLRGMLDSTMRTYKYVPWRRHDRDCRTFRGTVDRQNRIPGRLSTFSPSKVGARSSSTISTRNTSLAIKIPPGDASDL